MEQKKLVVNVKRNATYLSMTKWMSCYLPKGEREKKNCIRFCIHMYARKFCFVLLVIFLCPRLSHPQSICIVSQSFIQFLGLCSEG